MNKIYYIYIYIYIFCQTICRLHRRRGGVVEADDDVDTSSTAAVLFFNAATATHPMSLQQPTSNRGKFAVQPSATPPAFTPTASLPQTYRVSGTPGSPAFCHIIEISGNVGYPSILSHYGNNHTRK